MRKFFWQRWALIFLLVSRLVIGELGHAMPVDHSVDAGGAHHQAMLAEMSPGLTDPAACPEHECGSQDSQQTPAAEHASAGPASGEQDCCKSGECECPCVHVPCAALDALVLNPIATTTLRTPRGVEGLVSQRPSGLFRPPA